MDSRYRIKAFVELGEVRCFTNSQTDSKFGRIDPEDRKIDILYLQLFTAEEFLDSRNIWRSIGAPSPFLKGFALRVIVREALEAG